jgi:hypothetical protein
LTNFATLFSNKISSEKKIRANCRQAIDTFSTPQEIHDLIPEKARDPSYPEARMVCDWDEWLHPRNIRDESSNGLHQTGTDYDNFARTLVASEPYNVPKQDYHPPVAAKIATDKFARHLPL